MAVRRFENTDHAENYQKYRPLYPDVLYKTVLEYLHGSESGEDDSAIDRRNDTNGKEIFPLAVDVGCGTGQSVGKFVSHFNRLLGFDASPAQIEQAKANNPHKHLEYRVSEAESLPVEDACVDLLTVGMALHWFDHGKFYKEVDRVLRPGGVIAVYAHSFWIDIIDHPRQLDLNSCIREMMDLVLNQSTKYWHERDDYLIRRYTDKELQIPYIDCIRNESMYYTADTTIEGIFGYLKTRSGIYRYIKANGEDAIRWWNRVIQRFCEIYGSEDLESAVRYKIDVVLLMGKKPV